MESVVWRDFVGSTIEGPGPGASLLPRTFQSRDPQEDRGPRAIARDGRVAWRHPERSSALSTNDHYGDVRPCDAGSNRRSYKDMASMQTIIATVDIEAPPGAVWAVLMDWAAYPSWNPFIRAIAGKAKIGGRLQVRIGLPVGTVPITATVTRLRPEAEIAWHSGLPIRGLLDRDHAITILAQAKGCKITQTQTFDGKLVPAISIVADRLARTGLGRMNAALKTRVETILR